MSKLFKIIFTVLISITCVLIEAREPSLPTSTFEPTTFKSPERVALVLGGGGARGSAHIGVLEVLERERVPIDCVVGTSMGALVAGAYTSGVSPKDMRERLKKADWSDMFIDIADYSQLGYRTKKINKGLIAGTEIGFSKKGAQYQSGMISGAKIKLFFNYLVADYEGQRQVENSRIPLAIIATDIGTGERVILDQGSLTRAMRASMSVPGLMAPVSYEKYKLVDGGLVDNVPIQVARDLCQADRVIAVNVGTKLRSAEEISSLVSVTAQMIGILTDQNVNRSLATLTDKDIYIEPELGDIGATDFKRFSEAADIGKAATESHVKKLRELSVSVDTYALWQKSHVDKREPIRKIDEIKIAQVDLVHPKYIRKIIRQQAKSDLNREQLDQDLIRLYGTGNFDVVDYRVAKDDDIYTLEILPKERIWTGDSVMFGFSIADELRDGAQINLRGAYRKNWINSRGGEFFTIFDIGSEPYIEAEFYQPLDFEQNYFIEPGIVMERDEINLHIDNKKVAEYTLSTRYIDLVLGKNIGIWGQVRIGWRHYDVEGYSDYNPFDLPNVEHKYDGLISEVAFDTRNRLYFPSNGWRGDIQYFKPQDDTYEKLSANVGTAYPLGDFVVGLHANYVTSLEGVLPLYDASRLGGFLNLSGYSTQQIFAGESLYGHVRLEKIIGRMPLGFNGDMRVGIALEGARIKEAYTLTDVNATLDSAALFLGGESPFGPIYLGYGRSSRGDYNVYFQLGPYDRFKF